MFSLNKHRKPQTCCQYLEYKCLSIILRVLATLCSPDFPSVHPNFQIPIHATRVQLCHKRMMSVIEEIRHKTYLRRVESQQEKSKQADFDIPRSKRPKATNIAIWSILSYNQIFTWRPESDIRDSIGPITALQFDFGHCLDIKIGA